MITVPMLLFIGLCVLAGLGLLAAVAAWVRAQHTVDRILKEEFGERPLRPPLGADIARDGGPVRAVSITTTDQVPRRHGAHRGRL